MFRGGINRGILGVTFLETPIQPYLVLDIRLSYKATYVSTLADPMFYFRTDYTRDPEGCFDPEEMKATVMYQHYLNVGTTQLMLIS